MCTATTTQWTWRQKKRKKSSSSQLTLHCNASLILGSTTHCSKCFHSWGAAQWFPLCFRKHLNKIWQKSLGVNHSFHREPESSNMFATTRCAVSEKRRHGSRAIVSRFRSFVTKRSLVGAQSCSSPATKPLTNRQQQDRCHPTPPGHCLVHVASGQHPPRQHLEHIASRLGTVESLLRVPPSQAAQRHCNCSLQQHRRPKLP